jgi:hypothetical protein
MDQLIKPRVFIGSASEKLTIARMIEKRLQATAEVVIWDEMVIPAGELSLDALMNVVDTVDFAILVFSNDDKVSSRGFEFEAPRDNVIFELGLFMSKLGRHRTYIVNSSPGLKIPSDLGGITFTVLNTNRTDHNLASAVSPVCTELESLFEKHGIRQGRVNFNANVASTVNIEEHIAKSSQEIFRKIGIHQLDANIQTGYSIRDCLDTVDNSLSFLGIGGKKWVQEKKAFDELITRLLLRKHQIRFLLLNPDCKDALNFNEGRNFSHQDFVDSLNNTIDYFEKAKTRSGIDIQLRLYSYMPNFRITIIDQSTTILGTYSPLSPDGLDSPQIIFRNSSNWSFAHNLAAYFEHIWSESTIKI